MYKYVGTHLQYIPVLAFINFFDTAIVVVAFVGMIVSIYTRKNANLNEFQSFSNCSQKCTKTKTYECIV